MAYQGQPVPSTVVNISQVKISDGKSVDIVVPAGQGVEAGKFYLLSGFFGLVLKTVVAANNTAGETVAVQIENCEYITDQIDTAKTFALGSELYFDSTTGKFTDTSANGLLLVGRVSAAKDANNVIQFIRYPQVVTVSSGGGGVSSSDVTSAISSAISTHNSDNTAHSDIRNLIGGGE